MRKKHVTTAEYCNDIAFLCKTIDARYVYRAQKVSSWDTCTKATTALAKNITSRNTFIQLAERIIAELYDHHAGLRAHNDHSPLWVPTHTDIWVEYHNQQPIITAVRNGSPASHAKITPGSILLSINGVSTHSLLALQNRLAQPKNLSDAHSFTLRTALAGCWGEPTRTFTVQPQHGAPRTLELPSLKQKPSKTLVEHRWLNTRFGYIKLRDGLGKPNTIQAFDTALDHYLDADGLILDLRETPSGGSHHTAEPILGRFVTKDTPYQRIHTPLSPEPPNIACIKPRRDAPHFKKPIVVLVSRWTGSMGEGMAIGFDTMKHATVVGTRMAQLGGSVEVFQMPHTRIRFQLPSKQIDHMNTTPRETFVPPVLVDLLTETEPDSILSTGLRVLNTQA